VDKPALLAVGVVGAALRRVAQDGRCAKAARGEPLATSEQDDPPIRQCGREAAVNRERHKYWAAYIRDLQSRMLLADWEVRLGVCADTHECSAHVQFSGPWRRVNLFLGKDFESFTRTWQRRTIVHELVHLHLAPLREHLNLQLDEDSEAKAPIYNGHISHEEYAVDDLARIIAPRMPLPSKAKP
jgi:hypothetical protein